MERASEIRRQFRQQYEMSVAKTEPENKQKEMKFPVSKDGRTLNSNQAQAKFKLTEDDEAIILTVKLPKYKQCYAQDLNMLISLSRYLDTSLLEVDVQPTFVRVIIKGELLQLVLPEEIQSDRAIAQRSIASGDLVITMPMVTWISHSLQTSDSRSKKNCQLFSGRQYNQKEI